MLVAPLAFSAGMKVINRRDTSSRYSKSYYSRFQEKKNSKGVQRIREITLVCFDFHLTPTDFTGFFQPCEFSKVQILIV